MRDRDPGREPAAADRDRAASRRRGSCSASSSPIVPWPAITRSSSNAWTNVAPVSSTRRQRLGERVVEARAGEDGLGAVAERRLDLRHRRVLRHEDRRAHARARAPPTRPPGRGCRRSRRSRPRRARPARATRAMLTAPRILNEPVRWRFSALSTTVAAGAARERLGAVDRRHARAVADPLARGLDVSECRVGRRRRHRWGSSERWNTVSRISRTAVSGSSSRRSTSSSSRRSSGSSATACSRWRRARADATANTSAARLRRRRSSSVPSASSPARCASIAAQSSSIALAAQRLGEHDRRLRRRRREREHLPHVVRASPRLRVVGLVDRDHVGDLHDPGLQRLDRVARAGHQHEHDGVGDREHADLALARCRPSRGRRRPCRPRRAAAAPAASPRRARRAWPRVPIERMKTPGSRKWSVEPDPVAEQRALRERARRVDRDRRRRCLPRGAHVADERRDEARLADAGRPGEADRVRACRCAGTARGRARTPPGRASSTSEIARASARASPARTPSTRRSADHARRGHAGARRRPGRRSAPRSSSQRDAARRTGSRRPRSRRPSARRRRS